MSRCIASARFSMKADIVRGGSEYDVNDLPTGVDGYWESYQNPDTGAIERRWVETSTAPTSDIPNTIQTIDCIGRGFTDTGYRTPTNIERFYKGEYNISEFIELRYPASVSLNRNDLVANVRKEAEVVWKEDNGNPTFFDVLGETPILGPFNQVIEKMAILKRSEVQRGGTT